MRIAITAEQHKGEAASGELGLYKYKVLLTLNTTSPKVGALLSEKEIRELIDPCGLEVTVIPAK